MESLDCSPAPGGPSVLQAGLRIETAPHAAEAPSASAARPGAGEGPGDRTESASSPDSPVTRAASGRTCRACGHGLGRHLSPHAASPHASPSRRSRRLPARETPASASGSLRGHMTRGAESRAGRHVTARRRVLMTRKPALAVSPSREGS